MNDRNGEWLSTNSRMNGTLAIRPIVKMLGRYVDSLRRSVGARFLPRFRLSFSSAMLVLPPRRSASRSTSLDRRVQALLAGPSPKPQAGASPVPSSLPPAGLPADGRVAAL